MAAHAGNEEVPPAPHPEKVTGSADSAPEQNDRRARRRERARRIAAQRKAEKDAAKQAAISEAIRRIVAEAPPLDASIRARLADIIAATDAMQSYDDSG